MQIESCVNAVRTNPSYWSQYVSCAGGHAPLPALGVDPSLAAAAAAHTNDMTWRGYIGHT